MTSWSWINDPHERQNLSDKLYSKYRKDERNDDNIAADVELQNFDNIWRCACDKGQTNGIIRLCWLNLGRVSPRVYTFESKYCQHLVQLVLDGVGIKSLEGIPQHCHNLKLLSLASNEMTNIAGIHNLKSLTRLNLLRNSITHLPPQICDLVELEQLDVADNKLVHLPADIGNLVKLKCLNIESNELQNLPLSFKNLRCDTLILNCNNFSVFPASVLGMTRLKQLSMNRNKLGYLPSDIGNFNCLEKLHMSGNFINILPDSIVNVRSLRFLWLDFNKLSSLPPNFHRLTKLRELKLEGNPDLVYPPIETVAMGTAAVMTWSRNRSEMMKTSKVRCIVQSVEEVLHQVNRYKIGGILHESVFNIVGKAYQFPPDAFWNIFIPGLSEIWSKNTSSGGMKSFPFERHEVEQALLEFRDAAGPVVKRVSDAKFRRCSCLQSGRGAVCVPPKLGFMCQRPALLVRAKVAYEENMREKRRLAEESKRISNAVIAAKQESIAFLKSEDGMLMVREKAERRISEMEADAEEEGHKNDCDRKKFRGVSSKQIQSEILSAIISGAKSSISKVKTQVQGERKQKILQFENIVKQEYINDNVAKNTRKVLEDNRKIRWIMKSWMGLSVDDAFRGWLRCVKKTKQMQLQGNRSKLKQLRLSYEESIAKYEQKKLEHRNWAEIWDEFNDVPVWINSLTGASQYDEPTLQDSPLIPKILLDEDTGVFKSDSSSEYSDSERLSSEKHVPHGNEEEFELAATRVLEIRRNQLKSRYFC